MDINDNIDSPFELKISFNKLLEEYETLAKSEDELVVIRANYVLQIASEYPELREGFSDVSVLEARKDQIKRIERIY